MPRLKDYNKKTKTTILQALIKHGSLTRTDLIKVTGLSRATISIASSELIDMHLIKEATVHPSTGGRPAISLAFVEDTYAVLGIEFYRSGKPMWTLGVFDLTFKPIATKSIPANIRSPEIAIKDLQYQIKNFVMDLDINLLPIVGLGLPGIIDTQNGIVVSVPDLNWYQFDIAKRLKDLLGWNISVINHFKAHGLYESRYGEGKIFNELVYLGINDGIAGSIFHEKKLVHGSLGGAGEIGHMTIEPEGPLCSCGNRGCLEMMAAAPAIEKHVHQSDPTTLQKSTINTEQLRAKEICIAADKGKKTAVESIHRAASYLGIAMANIVNLYNPECIILGGFIVQNSKAYVEIAEKVMRQRALSSLSDSTKIYLASHPQYAGALGVAHEALERHMSIELF